MTQLMIKDIPAAREMERGALAAVRGGYAVPAALGALGGLGKVADVNINISQNIQQLQNVQVNALNNVGVIGAGFVMPKLDVSPSQWANAGIAL
ncbi:hypothetical protein SAMN06265795_104250 [Noviherbaspirillum humi]|uniref:Uncharacterized protein n=1 Tax=Noviherbaspirillum humi TaxID=1688639 RepID=A0A239G5S3_9BURK|nr:hypothetical protein [Noviherbaspirillum humi]SNS64118.1 hypothetical protein SAMN06265795_104250 [Noviherbaspirillum humi]